MVHLVKFDKSDFPIYSIMQDHVKASNYMSRFFPRAFDENHRANDELFLFYSIQLKNEKIGYIWIEKESPEAHEAVLGIMIGKSVFFGKGYGSSAIKKLVEI